MAITRGASAEPRPFPAAYQYDPPPGPSYGGIEPIATVPPPGSIIAASAPAQPVRPPVVEEVQDSPPPAGDLFASDRYPSGTILLTSAVNAPQPPLPHQLPGPAGVLPQQLGDWLVTVPTPGLGQPVEPPGAAGFGEELPPAKWYLRGEYLLWWTKADSVPALVTTTTTAFPPGVGFPVTPGSFRDPGTVELSGGELRRNPFSGGRFTAGYFLDDCGGKAIELSGFFLGPKSARFAADSFNTSVIARPFLRINDLTEDAEIVSFPGVALGRIEVEAPSTLWGLEPNLLCNICCDCDYRIDLLTGFRYLNLQESVQVTEVVFPDPQTTPPPLGGARVFIRDRFACTNQFYGGQVGAEARWQKDRYTLDVRAKVALGVTQQQLSIDGVTQINTTVPAPGGLLALPSNIGNRYRDAFTVIPEVAASAGYFLTDRLRANVGYDFLYWPHVVRPGGQIDRAIDVTQVPSSIDRGQFTRVSPPRPAQTFKSTDFWAHGLTFGLEYRY